MLRVPALDGVRGVAVLAVVAFHHRWQMPGGARVWAFGWMGVDLFFVLSGFLCTRILIEQDATLRGAVRFVLRRILRTWPIYFLCVAVVAATTFVPWPFAIYAQNLANGWREPFVLIHTWSLAVEEQFYLALPLAWLLLGRRGLPWAFALAIVVAVAARALYLQAGDGWAAYGYTWARLDCLAIGGLLAYGSAQIGGRTAAILVAVLVGAAIAGGVAAASADGSWQTLAWLGPVGGATLPLATAVGGAGLIRLLLAGHGACHRLFSSAILRHIGRVSYGIYLYHYLVQHLGLPWVVELPLLAAVVVLSWRYIETPCLRLKARL